MNVSLLDSIQSSSLMRRWKKIAVPVLALLLFLFLLFSWADNMILSADTSSVYLPAFNLIFQILRYLTYGAMLVAVVCNLLALRAYNLWTAGFIGLLGVIVFLFSRSMPLAILLIYLFAFAPLHFKTGLRVYLYTQTAILLGVVLLSAFGLLPDIIMDTQRARHALGFTWVTTAPILYFFVLLSLFLLKPKAVNSIAFPGLLGCCIALFFLSDTNFTFLATLTLLLVFGLYKIKPAWFSFTKSKWFYFCLMALPVVLSLLWLVLTISYSPDNAFLARLNGLLSGRIANSKAAFDQFGLSVFGKPIVWVGRTAGNTTPSDYLYVDCSYLNILLNYGIVFWALVMGWCMLMVRQAWLRKDTWLLVTLFFLLLFSVYEVRLLNPLYNPFLLTFSRLLCKPVFPKLESRLNGLAATLASRLHSEKKAAERKAADAMAPAGQRAPLSADEAARKERIPADAALENDGVLAQESDRIVPSADSLNSAEDFPNAPIKEEAEEVEEESMIESTKPLAAESVKQEANADKEADLISFTGGSAHE